VATGRAVSPVAERLSGRTFVLAQNDLGIETVSFEWPQPGSRPQSDFYANAQSGGPAPSLDRICVCVLKSGKGESRIECGLGYWQDGMCDVPGTPPKLTVGDLSPCKVAVSGAWKDENNFEMIWRYYETPHHDTVTCRFAGDGVTMEFKASVPGHKETRPVLRGEARA
jgi:hypothetical protein